MDQNTAVRSCRRNEHRRPLPCLPSFCELQLWPWPWYSLPSPSGAGERCLWANACSVFTLCFFKGATPNSGGGFVNQGSGRGALRSFGKGAGQRLGARQPQRSGLQVRATRPTPAPRGPTTPSVALERGLVSRRTEPKPVNCGGHRAPSCGRCPQGNG